MVFYTSVIRPERTTVDRTKFVNKIGLKKILEEGWKNVRR